MKEFLGNLLGMIMAASASSVWYNLRVQHPYKDVPVLDYDLALLFQPMLMLGITIGVSLSVFFPYWLITVFIIILFIGWYNYLCFTPYIQLCYSYSSPLVQVMWAAPMRPMLGMR